MPKPHPRTSDDIRTVAAWVFVMMLRSAAQAIAYTAGRTAQLHAVSDAMRHATTRAANLGNVADIVHDDGLTAMLADIVDALGDARHATRGRQADAVRCVIDAVGIVDETRDNMILLWDDPAALGEVIKRAADVSVIAQGLTPPTDIDEMRDGLRYAPQGPTPQIVFTRRPNP